MFFATNMVSIYDFDIYYMTSSSIYPVHSAAVISIQVSGTICYYRGLCGIYPYGYNAPSQEIATISVTVTNTGDFDETFTVTLQAINNTNYIARTSTLTQGPVPPGDQSSGRQMWKPAIAKCRSNVIATRQRAASMNHVSISS